MAIVAGVVLGSRRRRNANRCDFISIDDTDKNEAAGCSFASDNVQLHLSVLYIQPGCYKSIENHISKYRAIIYNELLLR